MKYLIISIFIISINVISAPHSDLHIDGTIVISNSSDAPKAGMIRYINGKFQGYDGTHWNQFLTEQIPNIEPPAPPLTDVDGNEYCTVVIKNQEWMCENLRVQRYQRGTPIQVVSDSTSWVVPGIKSMSYYDNDISNQEKYGALYNFHAIQGDSICPVGWKVPRESDWNMLETNLSGKGTSVLKKPGYWDTSVNEANNGIEFNARSSGRRDQYNHFSGLGDQGYWWVYTAFDTNSSYARVILSQNNILGSDAVDNRNGLSVRCVKN